MSNDMNHLFCESLIENDVVKLLEVPKSDIHNHSTKGCRRAWLEDRLQHNFPMQPDRFHGLDEMHEWFTVSIKPYCKGIEGITLRWEGAFSEAKRNNISRLAMSFGTQEIDLVGGLNSFISIIEGFQLKYCPDTKFEPEITYASHCDSKIEADRIEQYISSGYFKSMMFVAERMCNRLKPFCHCIEKLKNII